jgi:hypothetical protein
MSTLTVFADAADGRVRANHATYANARTGSGATMYSDTTSGYYGQDLGFYANEYFVSFDTSSIPDDNVVSNPVLSLTYFENSSDTNFIAQARLYDWGATLTTADWVSGDDLSSLPLLATWDTNSFTGVNTYQAFISEPAFANAINKTGFTRIIISSSRHLAGNEPTGIEYMGINSADVAGTTYDPKLVLTYAPPVFISRAVMVVTI